MASLFESLPLEVLHLIIDRLSGPAVQPRPPDCNFLRAKKQNSRRALSKASALACLCRASSRLNTFCQPVLYKHITIVDTNCLALLLRTLASDARLASQVHSFDCLVPRDVWYPVDPSADAPIVQNCLRTTSNGALDFEFYPALQHIGTIVASEPAGPPPRTSWPNFPMQSYMLFLDTLISSLYLMPNLSDACIPLHQEDTIYGASRAATVFNYAFRGKEKGSLSLFRRLDSLRLWAYSSQSYYVEVNMRGSAGMIYFIAPNLKSLQVLGDEGMWDSCSTFTPPNWRHGVTKLELFESSCTPSDIYYLCKHFSNLQTLTVTTAEEYFTKGMEDSSGAVVSGSMAPMENLNSALIGLKATLKHLHLRLNYGVDIRLLLGPDMKLTCISSLTKLETASLSMEYMFTKEDMMEGTSLADALPPSLIRLTLSVTGHLWEETWKRGTITKLRMFAKYGYSTCPKLRKLVIRYPVPWLPYSGEPAIFMAMLQEKGILLEGRPEYEYEDELDGEPSY